VRIDERPGHATIVAPQDPCSAATARINDVSFGLTESQYTGPGYELWMVHVAPLSCDTKKCLPSLP